MAKKKKGLVLNLNKKNKKKKKEEDKKKTAKKGGVVISQKSAQKKQAAKKANESLKKAVNLQKEEKYKSKETNKYKAAIDIAQHTSALGTKVEKKTGTVKVKGKDGKTEKVKYEYKPMTMQEYGKMEVGARTGRLKETLNSDKKLKKKVTDLNVKDYAEGALGMGMMDQMTQGLSVSEDPTYKYSKDQKKIIDSQKQTGKYNVGRVVGAVAEFGLGGTGTVGSALTKNAGKTVIGRAIKTTGKEALEKAAEQSGKKLVKETVKNATKEAVADTFAGAGLNILDAVKFSYKDGKIDKDTLKKELVFNIGGDLLIGGVVSGITHGLSAKQVSNFNKISKKKAKGEAVTEAEQKFYDKHLDDVTNKVQDRIRQLKEEDELKNKQQATKPSDAVDNTPVNHELTISKTETVEPAVAKSATTEQPKVETQKGFSVSTKAAQAYKTAEPERIGTDGATSSYVKPEDVPQELKTTFSEFINSTNEEIKQAVLNLRNGKPAGKRNFKIGKTTEQEVEFIKNELGIDVSGFTHAVEADRFLHIDERHGIVGKENQTMANVIDIARLGYVIEKADSIERVLDQNGKPVISSQYGDGKKNSPLIQYRKRVNGDILVVEAVPDTANKILRVESVYFDSGKTKMAKKISNSQEPNVIQPSATSESASGLMPNDKISENSTNVKNANAEWEATSNNAAKNPGKQFDNAKERIFDENKSPEELLEKSKHYDADEFPRVKQTVLKLANQAEDDVAEIFDPWIREGKGNKKVLQSQEEARIQAAKELADGRLYQNFMDSNVEADEHLFMARAEALLKDLMKKAPESDAAAEQMLKVVDKASEASSHGGRLLNATKMLLRNTPEGRLRMFSKELDRLNERFKGVLKGKKLELTPEQIKAIANATEENIEEVAEKINLEIWEDIPATWFEKFNELRHTSMLFNLKTHARNTLGNMVFWGGRLISDGIELAAYHMPNSPFKKRLKALGGDVQMVHVTRKELADNKKAVNDIFDSFYKKSGSKNKYIETTRPDGTTAIKNKVGSWIIQKNYSLLEAEDLLTFKPEYRKNFIRWCKAHNVELSDIPNMSKKQMREANAYAMSKAQKATFRDDSAFAEKIVGWKNTTATKTGKTPVGTAMYRAGNVALESTLPFVKTPVNILRRSVDYSPIGLARSAVELKSAKSADAFMEGVTHMASGLTGTMVFGLGAWLANRDLITVKTGEESGDAFYDRDMGYQDYSLVLGFGDKEYSWTIDWLSPMQVSLFMGADTWNSFADKGGTLEEYLDGVLTIAGPMLDMSFMSSTKDTIETFMEKVYRNGTGKDADWSGAIMKTLFGSVPQGYLSGFVPQLMSQTATALDSKQRDTRSTLEDPIASSWDSFAKKLANKIPVLRNMALNPKIDRFGEDVTTGNNIVTRLLNAYANPSTVKEIKRTDLDNEIIDIYNHMEDGDDKKYFYYNFTGNPSYDLGDGKRMSYDELYKYGKSKRIDQTKSIQAMVDSKSYKNMTYDMKAKEIEDAHWTSQTHADQKTYGSDFALNKIVDGGSETDIRAAKLSQQMNISSKEFVDFYIAKEKLIARSHDSDYTTKALAVALSGNDKMAELYAVNADKVKAAKKYLKKGGSAEEYSTASCNIASEIKKADATVSKKNKALAAAYHDINERTYNALGLSANDANMGAGLKKMGYDFSKLLAMQTEMKYGGYDADKNGYMKKSEVIDYIESLGINSTAEKACLFEYLCPSSAKNPYGSIPNYLGLGGSSSSSGGGGGGGGRRSSGSVPSWDKWVKDYLNNDTPKYESVKFDRWDSPLDSAYRKKITSLNTK